jgi:4'-phosphopantetheinyl transferase
MAVAALARQGNWTLPRDISLLQCRLETDADMALTRGWSLLSAEETARANRFHFARDRDRYVRARAFLRTSLGQALRKDPASLTLAVGPRGKPYLPGHDLEFNLSHSRDHAVLALSRLGPVGIDVEFLDRQVDVGGLAKTCFDPVECAVLNSLSEEDRVLRFFAFWTAKEARMKLTGEGMALPPRQISLALEEGWPVGYLRPEGPAITTIFPQISRSDALCCVSFYDDFSSPSLC